MSNRTYTLTIRDEHHDIVGIVEVTRQDFYSAVSTMKVGDRVRELIEAQS